MGSPHNNHTGFSMGVSCKVVGELNAKVHVRVRVESYRLKLLVTETVDMLSWVSTAGN